MAAEENGKPTGSPNRTSRRTRLETLQFVLALFLLVIGFALTVYGWYRNDDHIYHLGLALGPAGLIVLVFEYLARISLDTRHAVEMDGIRSETANSLQKIADEILRAATFDLDQGKSGLVGIYANRADAVRRDIARLIDREDKGIWIVGSTIFGLNCHIENESGRTVLTAKDLIARIEKRKEQGCEVRILLTHPKRVIERHSQEAGVRSAGRGTIASELRQAWVLLKDHHLAGCTKLYDGSPTCFTVVFEGQKRMIVNPYPYEGEAYNSWAIMIEERENGIYKPFFKSHVNDPWTNKKLAIPLTQDRMKDLREAEEAERKIDEAAAAKKAKQDEQTDQNLSSCLPGDQPQPSASSAPH